MSVSYAVSQDFSPRLALWMFAGGIVRAVSFTGKAYRIAAKVAFLLWCTITMLAVMLWKGKPSAATLLIVGKALALSSLCAAGMVLALVAPMVLVAMAVLVMYAEVTKPRAK